MQFTYFPVEKILSYKVSLDHWALRSEKESVHWDDVQEFEPSMIEKKTCNISKSFGKSIYNSLNYRLELTFNNHR